MSRIRKCACCGKDFYSGPIHAYKFVYKGKTQHCCSYTCYNTKLLEKENKDAHKGDKENS